LVVTRSKTETTKIMVNKFISTLGAGLASAALLGLAAPAAFSADEFSPNAITFDRDTAIEFEFLESHGSFLATFGVMDLNSGEKTPLIKEDKPSDSNERAVNKATDFLGTPNNAVSQPKNTFTFKANTPYTLYLESRTGTGRVASLVFSNDLKNPSNRQQTKFDKGFDGLGAQGVKINWDDQAIGRQATGAERNDDDFNDFVIIAGGGYGCNCSVAATAPVTPDVPQPPEERPRKPRNKPRGRG
jgi:hypothetical protein